MPLVPDASSGGSGVLSHKSTPAVRSFATSGEELRQIDVVIFKVHDRYMLPER
jgi:hypothetical protein